VPDSGNDGVTVTIGIPFLNARRTLADAVRSVFAQTHGDWELLLVDDGSTDGSSDVVRQLLDPRVRLLADGVTLGLCARLNQIAAAARGAYLARMVDTATFTVDDDLTPLGIRGERPLDARPEAVLRDGLLIHPTITGRTEWFRRNPYDGRFVRAEDRELWVRTCASTTFARLPAPLFFYREAPAGNLANYLRTERTVRDVLRRYGPPVIGAERTRRLVMRSRLKSMAYLVGTRLGVQGRLIRRRNRPLAPAEAAAARLILTEIWRTVVPGLEGDGPSPVEGRRRADEAAA
jgi:glycosyltransferase involved in cell wall biosynthesis